MGNQATEKNKFEKEKALLLCVSKAVKKLSAVDKAHDFYSVQNEAGIDLRKKISKDKGNLDSPAVRYMIDKIIEIMTGNRSCNFRSYAEIQSSISEIGSYIEAIKAGDLYTVLSLGFRMSVPECLVRKDAERIRDNGSGVIKRLYESTFRSRVYYMECGSIADVLYDLIEEGEIKAPPVDRYLLYAVARTGPRVAIACPTGTPPQTVPPKPYARYTCMKGHMKRSARLYQRSRNDQVRWRGQNTYSREVIFLAQWHAIWNYSTKPTLKTVTKRR